MELAELKGKLGYAQERLCSADGCNETLEGRSPRARYCSHKCKDSTWWTVNRQRVREERPDTDARKEEARSRLLSRREVSDSGCWLWGGKLTHNGYGVISIWSGNRIAHRIAWEAYIGPIPEGLQIDHLCRNRACFNPDHLEPVTQRENLLRGETGPGINARKTHCLRGHEFTPENIYWYGPNRDRRQCRTCTRARQNARRAAGLSS